MNAPLARLHNLAYEIYDGHTETALKSVVDMTEAEAKGLLVAALLDIADRWEHK